MEWICITRRRFQFAEAGIPLFAAWDRRRSVAVYAAATSFGHR
jgi:hypothetical protein